MAVVMMPALLVLASLCDWSAGRRLHGNHGLLPPPLPASANVMLPPDQWFTQKLDHSQPSDLRTWQQRYFTTDTYYRPGGPVFLMIGGEGEAKPVWMVTGQWIEYAKQHGALCFLLEHRFYGKSHPTNDLSVKNLRYLSSEQALADLAAFSAAMTEQHALPEGTRWVAFGGSYPGSLAAWYRLKYPHMVHAAVSTSAPLHAKPNFHEFLAVVSDALKSKGGDNCYNSVAEAFASVDQMLDDQGSWDSLSKQFKLCTPFSGASEDASNLVSMLADHFEGTVQYNEDNRAFEGAKDANITISLLCNMMTSGAGSALQRLSAVNAMMLEVHGEQCLEHTYEAAVKELRQESFAAADGGRQWMYQTCAEFGWYQTSDYRDQPFGHRFPLAFSERQCMDVYGTKFDAAFIARATAATNVRYGGRHLRVRRVVFVNGSIDPWHAMGLTRTHNRHAPVIYINGTAHCANMYPARAADSQQLTEARLKIGNLLTQWLKQRH